MYSVEVNVNLYLKIIKCMVVEFAWGSRVDDF